MRSRRFSPEPRPKKPIPKKWVLLLLVNTVVIFGIYSFFVMRMNINWIFWLYYAALAVTGIGYLIYNRGFSEDKLTLEMLPPEWSEEKKHAFLFARDERKRRSKWLLTILFPLCITIFFDIIFLFYGEQIMNALNTIGGALGL